MGQVWGYARSTAEPLTLSIQEQEQRIYEYAKIYLPTHDWMGVSVDDRNNARPMNFLDRPMAAKLCYGMREGDHLVLALLHRGFRRLQDLHTCSVIWAARGITMHALDTVGKDGLDLLAALAEWEAYVVKERWRDGTNRHGNGNRPYGWHYVGPRGRRRLVPNEKERDIVREAVRLMGQENLSATIVARQFKAEKKRIRRGGRYRNWTYDRLQSVFRYAKDGCFDDWLDPSLLRNSDEDVSALCARVIADGVCEEQEQSERVGVLVQAMQQSENSSLADEERRSRESEESAVIQSAPKETDCECSLLTETAPRDSETGDANLGGKESS